ncbi:hypothetical protein DASC09_021000 [Saccharomycopsis crataegensis]|uniref:UBA domain-containing protein n=1 Tax=Saccharomycopsis crataegensis TaxID=43959 RepID=A0AAV5QK80_9ASCO|nr:hypothetical protein DASC09_021000 [Saccharomycopsis crataegensis]
MASSNIDVDKMSEKDMVHLLKEMGFAQEKLVQEAAKSSGGDLYQALAYLEAYQSPKPSVADQDLIDLDEPELSHKASHLTCFDQPQNELRNDLSYDDVKNPTIEENYDESDAEFTNAVWQSNIRVEHATSEQEYREEIPVSVLNHDSSGDGYNADYNNRYSYVNDGYNSYGENYSSQCQPGNLIAEKQKSIFEDCSKFKCDQVPSVITPVDTPFFENYFVYVIMIFHEIPSLRNILLSKGFESYGYRANWWKDEIISLPPDVTNGGGDASSNNLKFLMEIQRLLGFLDGNYSKRSFASTKSYTRSLPSNITSDLETEPISDVFHSFYETIIAQLSEMRPEISEVVSNLFNSKISTEDDHTSVFVIESDVVKPNFYETLHNLFWQESLQGLGIIYFEKLSDIITVSYQGFEPSYSSSSGLIIEALFYPQIYTKKYEALIRQMVQKQFEKARKIQEYSSVNGSLVAFQGKRVKTFLKGAIDHLVELNDGEVDNDLFEAIEDLNLLEENINDKGVEISSEKEKLEKESSTIDISNIENILNFIKNLPKQDKTGDQADQGEINNNDSKDGCLMFEDYQEILDNPYCLTGVIINEVEFYYLLNSSHPLFPGVWVHLHYEGDPKTTNFHAQASDFQTIRNRVEEISKLGTEDNLVLIYAKKAFVSEDKQSEIPPALKEFLEKDNQNLDATVQEWEKSQEIVNYEKGRASDLTEDDEESEEMDYVNDTDDVIVTSKSLIVEPLKDQNHAPAANSKGNNNIDPVVSGTSNS